VNAIAAGTLINAQGSVATFGHSIDASGVCLISISALNNKASIKGAGELLVVDVEAIGAGAADLFFDQGTLQLVASDALDLVTQVKHGSVIVKQ
jgi:hypothetical protein